MASRIVLLGWRGLCMELTSPDAEILTGEGTARVSFTMYGGDLADATVLQFTDQYLHEKARGRGPREAHAAAWEVMCMLMGDRREFTVPVPIPVG